MRLTSKQLARAAAVAEEIESLQKQVNDLLQGNEFTNQPKKAPQQGRTRNVKKAVAPVPAANKETRSTLSSAVVSILKRSGKPLKVADIFEMLTAEGYPFKGKEPKKVLGIRLYKMAGVQVLGDGLFQAK